MLGAIINLFISASLLIGNLIVYSSRDQVYPTPQSDLVSLYNLFISGNLVLPLLVVYVILSILYFLRVKRKRG